MNRERLKSLADRLNELEREINFELQKELKEKRDRLLCDFAEEKISLWRYIAGSKPLFVITAPVIYSMIIPAVIMDIFVTVYQAVCFPVYGIEKAKREDYIIIDRHKLPYLNILQKLNCIYCGYFNGLIAYVREISSRTEQYWCPIRHSRLPKGVHERYLYFLEYGDGKDVMKKIDELREKLHSIDREEKQ